MATRNRIRLEDNICKKYFRADIGKLTGENGGETSGGPPPEIIGYDEEGWIASFGSHMLGFSGGPRLVSGKRPYGWQEKL
jgi:hypothetical protein